MKDFKEFINENKELIFSTHKALCLIPAPSYFEQKRAEYIKNWLENIGAKGVYIDEALNVIFPLNCEKSNEISVFAAHTDTVFPDLEPLPYEEKDGIIYNPGCGDDTAGVVVVMFAAKYFVENNIVPPKGIMFVANSCEEGLGDLKGSKTLFKNFANRIKQFVSFDGTYKFIHDKCVGSHRYEVEVKTKGGHALDDFGTPNSIAELSKIISKIYEIEVPRKNGCLTSYNVGVINGGTSINTIAQSAKMLCEYRSQDVDCLAIMKDKFETIFENAKKDGVEVIVKKIGDRPCMGNNLDLDAIEKMALVCEKAMKECTGYSEIIREPASTDCNVPLSLGVNAICLGVCKANGFHTREENMEKQSLLVGTEIGLKIIKGLLEE